ncbi:MAG TPA: polyprenyl diphosphate synthase [Candidatus Lokiarchaeia archaeon]|nr:polyprenyl diphosphate synthase [Candidatus Lokiarchaeia archaeon]
MRFVNNIKLALLKRRINRAKKAGFALPEHVGLIPDGNRRWAEKHHIQPFEGHRMGYQKVKDLLDWALESGIKTLTLFAFSTENFNRSPAEVEALMEIFISGLQELAEEDKLHKNQVKVGFLGNRSMITESLLERMHTLEDVTKDYGKFQLNLAIAYGGRDEIIRVTQDLAKKVQNGEINPTDITEDLIGQSLDTAGQRDPDLIIRTSNEQRVSGFLLWQGSYSELLFQAPLFPAYDKCDFFEALHEFQKRKRRFGK